MIPDTLKNLIRYLEEKKTSDKILKYTSEIHHDYKYQEIIDIIDRCLEDILAIIEEGTDSTVVLEAFSVYTKETLFSDEERLKRLCNLIRHRYVQYKQSNGYSPKTAASTIAYIEAAVQHVVKTY